MSAFDSKRTFTPPTFTPSGKQVDAVAYAVLEPWGGHETARFHQSYCWFGGCLAAHDARAAVGGLEDAFRSELCSTWIDLAFPKAVLVSSVDEQFRHVSNSVQWQHGSTHQLLRDRHERIRQNHGHRWRALPSAGRTLIDSTQPRHAACRQSGSPNFQRPPLRQSG